jgi:hypothetical protein
MSASNTSSALVDRFAHVIGSYGSREASAPSKAPQSDQSAALLSQIAARLSSRPQPTKKKQEGKVSVQVMPSKKSRWVFQIEYDAYSRPSRIHATPVDEVQS